MFNLSTRLNKPSNQLPTATATSTTKSDSPPMPKPSTTTVPTFKAKSYTKPKLPDPPINTRRKCESASTVNSNKSTENSISIANILEAVFQKSQDEEPDLILGAELGESRNPRIKTGKYNSNKYNPATKYNQNLKQKKTLPDNNSLGK